MNAGSKLIADLSTDMAARSALRGALLPMLAIATLALFFLPVILGWPSTVTDDYYYYERIARHLAAGDGSTYDGVVRTNGYHPLWMALVVGAVGLEHVTGLATQYWSLIFCAALAIGTLWLSRRESPLSLAAAAGLILLATYGVFFGVMAMETSLVLFCGAWFFRRMAGRDFVPGPETGALLSLCFLARIDSLVYFFPLVFWIWWQAPLRHKILFTTPIVLTVAVYCGLSLWHFGLPLPISGMAKAVRHITTLHAATWQQVLVGRQNQLMTLAAGALTAVVFHDANARAKTLIALSTLGVLLFYTVNSLRSDWMIWEWYLYPFALHAILVMVVAPPAASERNHAVLRAIPLLLAVAALALVGFRNQRHAGHQQAMVEAARRIAVLIAAQPLAVVAMGDRAGAVGERSPNRLVQLEGLVMDPQFLDRLRRANSIVPILESYAVDYYVATNPRRERDGCYTSWEPMQSRGASIKVESRICARVVAEFSFDGYLTAVFARPFS